MALNGIDARQALASRSISIEMLATLVGPLDDGFAVLTGSIVDGFPNADSDIDILVVSRSKPIGPTFNFNDGDSAVYSAAIAGTEVNIELYAPEAFDRVGSYMRNNVEVFAGRAPVTALTFFDSFSDLRLIHRVATGVPLIGEAAWREAQASLGVEYLPFYVCGLRTKEHFALREDAISDFGEGAGLSALVQARSASVQLVHGALALRGCTHAGDRWLAHYLTRPVFEMSELQRERLLRLLTFPYSLQDATGVQAWLDDCNEVVGQSIISQNPNLARLFLAISSAFPVRMAL